MAAIRITLTASSSSSPSHLLEDVNVVGSFGSKLSASVKTYVTRSNHLYILKTMYQYGKNGIFTPWNLHVWGLSSTDLILQTFHVKDKIRQVDQLATFSTQDVSRIDNLTNNNNSQTNFVKRSRLFCNDHDRIETRYTNDIISINFQQCYNRI